jgi:hypothetical protein
MDAAESSVRILGWDQFQLHIDCSGEGCRESWESALIMVWCSKLSGELGFCQGQVNEANKAE